MANAELEELAAQVAVALSTLDSVAMELER